MSAHVGDCRYVLLEVSAVVVRVSRHMLLVLSYSIASTVGAGTMLQERDIICLCA